MECCCGIATKEQHKKDMFKCLLKVRGLAMGVC